MGLPATLDPPHMASPTATRPPISLARGALSPMELELPSTLDMPPAMLDQPPMACPIFSMARGVPTPTLTLRPTMLSMASTQWVTMDQLTPTSTSTERGAPTLMLMLMLMPIMATMATATVTPTMVMATAMASPTGDRCHPCGEGAEKEL